MAGQASVENGKKGGRPKGSIAKSTQKALMQRSYVQRRFEEELAPIVDKALEQAIAGDKYARDWLSDRSWGKSKESMDITSAGAPIPIYGNQSIQRHNRDEKDIPAE